MILIRSGMTALLQRVIRAEYAWLVGVGGVTDVWNYALLQV